MTLGREWRCGRVTISNGGMLVVLYRVLVIVDNEGWLERKQG